MKKVLLLLLTAIVITLLSPNRALIDLNRHKGEIWNDETLVASFDTPILKKNSVIEQEREEVIKNFMPIFRVDTAETNRKINSLILFLQHNPDLESQIDSISSYLHQVANRGIVIESEAVKYKDKIVRVSSARNEMSAIPMSELYTPNEILNYLAVFGIEAPYVTDFIKPNLIYDDLLNQRVREDEINNISTTRSMIRAGETIVTKGQVIDNQTLQVLSSFKREYETQVGRDRGILVLMFGRFVLIFIILGVSFYYFEKYAQKHFNVGIKPWIFISLLYVVMVALVAVVGLMKGVSPYVVPLPVVAIYLMSYFSMRVAIMGNITIAAIGALFVRIPFDFFLVNFIAGMMVIYVMRHQYRRNNLFKAIGLTLVAQVVVYLCVSLIREVDVSAINYQTLIWFLLNVILILGLYQAVYPIERIFGFISDVTLLELCDTNQPLLLQLAEKAPGTFQHSIQVANLAEGAAKEIGANPLLARTGALYHDIGKMENPHYFAENQTGVFNPHNDMPPLESAAIIRQHVTGGVVIAQKNRLPQQVISFIESHHGTSVMYFFYSKQMELNVSEVTDKNAFCYPGPKPVTKEVSICMIADAVEAASRSLKSYEKETLDQLVDKIIDIQLKEEQLSDSELSFCQVETIRNYLKSKLNTIYHPRISYPERKS